MPAGTIALTNNSTAVTGTGTSFTTELKANDFVVAVVGGVAYTLGIKSVDSNTALTLAQAYAGPAASGLAWTPVPFGTMTAITAQLAAQVTYAVRGFNLDKANWQGIFTGTGNVTVNLPDGTSWSGPAWGGIAKSLNNKANLVNDVVEVSHGGTGQKTLSGVMTWLGLGDAAFKNTGTTSGTLAAGNDGRFNSVDGKTGGGITGSLFAKTVTNNTGTQGGTLASTVQQTNGTTNSQFQMFVQLASGGQRYGFMRVWQDTSYKDWYLDYNSGVGYAPTAWQQASDRRVKDNIERISAPLEKMRQISGCTWTRKDDQAKGAFGIGFIAQEIQKVFPGAISHPPEGSLKVNGEVITDPLALSPGDIAAALHHEAILALMDKVEKQDAVIAELQNRMKAIDGLDA